MSVYEKILDDGDWGCHSGGDWTWLGGRMIQGLIRSGFVDDAYRQVLPMVERVQKNDGFYEWYTVDNEPKGAREFRASAGILGEVVNMLIKWVRREGKSR